MEWLQPYANVVGHVGVFCFLLAYFLLQRQKLTFDSLAYLGLNLAGSLLVMLSLLVDWNASAFVLEAFWAIISIYGIYCAVKRAR
jgi:membrane-bound ClpP family serine protease